MKDLKLKLKDIDGRSIVSKLKSKGCKSRSRGLGLRRWIELILSPLKLLMNLLKKSNLLDIEEGQVYLKESHLMIMRIAP